MGMDRRSFLGLTGGAAAVGMLGTFGLDQPAAAHAGGTGAGPPVLVVVDLQGGNDALNTLVPESGIYRDLRPSLAVPEDDLLTFTGLSFGVHPALGGLQGLWDAGKMVGIYGTGLEGQGRSHFVAQDAWRTARPGRPERTGWIGRWLDQSSEQQSHPLRAITIGQSALAASGVSGQPVSIRSITSLSLASPSVAEVVMAMSQPVQPGTFGSAQTAIPEAVWASGRLREVLGTVPVDEDADPDADGSVFRAVRALIEADLGTQVIYLTVNGFDTHALQKERHGALLQLVGDGLGALYAGLQKSGHASRTLTMVVSEFGRRVAENGAPNSAGTDHGRGGLSFFLGGPIALSGVIGRPDLGDLINGDLRVTTDARVLYDNALRWLGASADESAVVLDGSWRDFNVLG